MKRQFSPYEISQLRRYHLDNLDLNDVGDKPIEYITGHVEFSQLDFLVNKDTLIPRIETEEIIEIIKQNMTLFEKDYPLTVVDVGTGSGCLGISVALMLKRQDFKNINLYLTDISEKALKVASVNASRLLPKSIKVNILKSDLLIDFPDTVKINVLISNLPYIPSNRIETLDNSVKNYEPISALDGGPKGLSLINKLLLQLPNKIIQPFIGTLEIDHTHKKTDFKTIPGYSYNLKIDQFKHTRFLVLKPTQ